MLDGLLAEACLKCFVISQFEVGHVFIGCGACAMHLFELSHDDDSCFAYRKGLPNHTNGSENHANERAHPRTLQLITFEEIRFMDPYVINNLHQLCAPERRAQ